MNILNSLAGQGPRAAKVIPWHGVYSLRYGEKFILPPLRKSLWHIIAGFFTGGAFLFIFLALHMERVTIISPLASSYSVFVLLLTPLVAGKIEVITPRKVTGALLVVTGVIFLSMGRN